jgi:peptide/nickel transport system substrate-binding protein
MKRSFLACVSVVLSLAVIFCGVAHSLAASAPSKPTATPATQPEPKASAPQYGGVLKMIYNVSPLNLGYPPTADGDSTFSASPCLQNIIDIDTQGRFKPTKLATGFEVAKDGKSVKITLRRGVKFHDGTDCNAQAIKWNLDKAMEAKTYGTATWGSTDVIDDDTVRLNLKQVDFTVTANFARTATNVVSPTAVEKNGVEWAMTHPVGTGPFKLKSFERDTRLQYEKFTDYWDKRLPYLDGMEFIYIQDPMVQSAALQTGEGHVLWRATPQQATDLRARGFEVISPWNQWLLELTPDSVNADSPLANKKVREALEYATDRRGIAKAVGYGFWTALDQPCDPHYVAGYIPNFKGREYDPKKAKQLLAEAGYSNGFKTRIIAQIGAIEQDALVAIQRNWKDVGVDVTLEVVPRAKFVEYRSKGWRNGFVFVRTGVDEAYTNTLDRVLSADQKTYTSTLRPSNWGKLLEEAVASLDYNTFKARTQKCVKLLHDEATFLPAWGTSQPFVQARSVHDTGFFSVTFTYWTPEKSWIIK